MVGLQGPTQIGTIGTFGLTQSPHSPRRVLPSSPHARAAAGAMAQVESTPTTAGMAVCVKDEALGGALRAGTVEVVASEITRRVRHFIASSCASPPSLPPLEHTTKWLNYLEGVARGRLQTLSKVRVVVSRCAPRCPRHTPGR